ncbi:MAG: enoyl-CoA hydratase/isomerase family protein [Spirochaetes bacterium]|nr:MAG: enoyl-CoA hydratase/isomerase family protein [Spirochaetota bacterium]
MDTSEILTDRSGSVGLIILNRSEEMNTFTQNFAEKLSSALIDFDDDEEIRVVIIKAEGKNFSAGISLDSFKDKDHREYREFLRMMDLHNHTIAKMKKPVIGAVKGYTLANGAGLAFACDLVIAAEDTKLGTTAINVGLICLGPAVPLNKIVGRRKTLEMVLTGDMMTAGEALALGLVNRVVPADELEDAAMELALKLAKKSPLAMEVGKRGIYALEDLSYHQGADLMTEYFANLCSTEDAEEGVAAFLEKRKPNWKMK